MAEYIERESLLKIVDRRLFELRKEYGPFDHYMVANIWCVLVAVNIFMMVTMTQLTGYQSIVLNAVQKMDKRRETNAE